MTHTAFIAVECFLMGVWFVLLVEDAADGWKLRK